jgi:subtilase family serine protease
MSIFSLLLRSLNPPPCVVSMLAIVGNIRSLALVLLVTLTAAVLPAAEDRVRAQVNSDRTVVLERHVRPEAQARYDQGPVDPDMPISSLTLVLKPAATIASFLAEQQNPSSPNYRRWLTPEQFGDRFGLSSRDLSMVVSWLEAQGFRVERIARGRHWINFSGTAGQASRAFRTGIHRYRVNGETHFANVLNPAIPEAFSGVVAAVRGLHDFRPQSYLVDTRLQPEATVGSVHYLAPDDLATIYNIKPLYSAGIDGSGQTVVIVGASAPPLSDVRSFRKQFNLPQADPTVVLVGGNPGTNTGWQEEAALDLEWVGAVARNAALVFVYSNSLTDAVQYAVDQNLGTIISMSFGSCELWECARHHDAGILRRFRRGAVRPWRSYAAGRQRPYHQLSGESSRGDRGGRHAVR